MEHLNSDQLMEIHTAFEATEYGQILANNIRYARYKPEAVTNERWVELLGADVNNLTHLTLTYGLAVDFIRSMEQNQPGFFEADEVDRLKVAALTHDWAEAIVGDTSYGDKTADHEQQEQTAFREHFRNFADGRISSLIDDARSGIIFDHNGTSKLGRAFNAIEKVGYMRTALRASGHIANNTAPECDAGLRWLVADVLVNQPESLIGHAENFVPIKHYLQNQSTLISRAFHQINNDPEVFTRYPTSDQRAMQKQFEHSYAVWTTWVKQNNQGS